MKKDAETKRKRKKVRKIIWKTIGIVLIFTVLVGYVYLTGVRKASWISDERHLERIAERIQKKYIDGDETVGYPAVKPTSFKITPVYNQNDEMEFCLVEFEPYGFKYVRIRDNTDLSSVYGMGTMYTTNRGGGTWTPFRVDAENGNEIIVETDKNTEEILSWCSEKHSVSVGNVNVEFCECCSLGMLAETNGEYSEFAKRAKVAELMDKKIDSYTINDYFKQAGNELEGFFYYYDWWGYAMDLYEEDEGYEEDKEYLFLSEELNSRYYRLYYDLLGTTQTIFNASNNPVTSNVNYCASEGAIVGINTSKTITFEVGDSETSGSEKYLQSSLNDGETVQPFTISYTKEEAKNTELKNIVARLFGCEDADAFMQYAQKLADYYALKSGKNELCYDGAIKNTKSSVILPYTFKSGCSETVLAYIAWNYDNDTKSYDMYVWISDVESAKTATNYNGALGDDERAKLEVYGRCILFEQAHKTRYSQSPFALRAQSDERFYLLGFKDTYIPAVKRNGAFINLYTNEELLTYNGALLAEQLWATEISFTYYQYERTGEL